MISIDEFARQVLFSTNLDEKLRIPEAVDFNTAAQPIETPDMPGRPDSLRFADSDAKTAFPGISQLSQRPAADSERGAGAYPAVYGSE